jgi:hypothetical protein
MELNSKCMRLADEIRRLLDQGIILDEDVVQFINSTFSSPTVSELEDILADDTNIEKDSLLELLFFPDAAMQLQLEPLLEQSRLRREDENRVAEALARKPLPVTLHFPEHKEALTVELPAAVAPAFISRLRISKRLDPRLREAIDKHVAADAGDCCKVKIRNSRFAPGENAIQFLCAFFEKIGAQSYDFYDCLDFAVLFLDEIQPDTDIYQGLMAKKRFYLRSLQIASQLERQLQKHNLETLISQGKRVIGVDPADARKKMLTIDRICRAVYGKTEYFEALTAGEDQFEIDPGQDIQDIISRLS